MTPAGSRGMCRNLHYKVHGRVDNVHGNAQDTHMDTTNALTDTINVHIPVGKPVVHRLATASIFATRTACGRGWANYKTLTGSLFAQPTDEDVSCEGCIEAMAESN